MWDPTWRIRLLVLLLGAVAVACATHLRPAPDADVTAGPGFGAADSQAGVRVEARVEAWGWSPSRLESELTPVLVEIENQSQRPLRVRFEDFALVDGAGGRYAALPPFDIEAEVTERVPGYAHAWHGFHVAPHLGLHYPHASIYPGVFVYDSLYYDSYYPRLREVQLPTPDMLAYALPEGVVGSGGRASGFLYFERVEDPAEGVVHFRFPLVDAVTERSFGRVEIPFRAGSGLFAGG